MPIYVIEWRDELALQFIYSFERLHNASTALYCDEVVIQQSQRGSLLTAARRCLAEFSISQTTPLNSASEMYVYLL